MQKSNVEDWLRKINVPKMSWAFIQISTTSLAPA